MELHIPFRSQHRLPCASLLDTFSFSLPVLFGAKQLLHKPIPADLVLNLSIERTVFQGNLNYSPSKKMSNFTKKSANKVSNRFDNNLT
jgi:hypothetical protein